MSEEVRARAYAVKHEGLGEVIYVDVYVGDDAFRAYVWRCPLCAQSFKSMSLQQLRINIENHKRKHVDWGGGGG